MPSWAMSKVAKFAPLDRLRAICMALPEAVEKQTWEIPTFRIRDKIFAMAHDPGTVWCKAPRGVQAILVGAAPEWFFVPPYVGHKGWIGLHLDTGTDWADVSALIRRSYRMTAPKRLAALVPEEGGFRSGESIGKSIVAPGHPEA